MTPDRGSSLRADMLHEARVFGKCARERGEPITACPHREATPEERYWTMGWEQAHREARDEEERKKALRGAEGRS